jgi:amphi-Trp domain-containing protein
MSDKEIGYKRMVDMGEAVAYLEALAQSFRDGHIVVEHGEHKLDLAPPSVVVLEIEAKLKKDKSKFAFEIGWKHAYDKDGDEKLKISSGTQSNSDDLPPAA